MYPANFVKGVVNALVSMRFVGFEGGRTADAKERC